MNGTLGFWCLGCLGFRVPLWILASVLEGSVGAPRNPSLPGSGADSRVLGQRVWIVPKLMVGLSERLNPNPCTPEP